ncbi:MAG: DUF2202 domain-containing protein [Porticoccaceae bacterium]|nr:DUF2202 domain-containing protein [Porticoccaceae bacterium]
MNSLTEDDKQVLAEALDDEYKAYATYDQVINDFGSVRPFSNIREAEGRHIDALLRLYRKYGLPIPENPWPEKVPRYNSLLEACEAGVAAEIENGEMYNRLLRQTQRDDIQIVLKNLQEASQQRHLPAFQRCAGGNRGAGRGRGRGKGFGHGRGCKID